MYKEFITSSLEQASGIARDNFGRVSHTVKAGDNNQVLTETDLAIGEFLVNKVRDSFPEHNVIDEEAGGIDNGSAYTWVIGPIDGTSNFAAGLPHYGIMIGLLEHGVPIAGGIALPYFNEIYVAEKGKGTWLGDRQIHASTETNLMNMLVSYGIDGNQQNPEITRQESRIIGEIALNIRNLRASGSAYDVIQVALGTYGAFLTQTSKIWDNVAPQIIVEEAGGIYTDFWGKPIDYSDPMSRINDNFSFCAASGGIQQKLQEIVRSAN